MKKKKLFIFYFPAFQPHDCQDEKNHLNDIDSRREKKGKSAHFIPDFLW